jgi:hypothetical protein
MLELLKQYASRSMLIAINILKTKCILKKNIVKWTKKVLLHCIQSTLITCTQKRSKIAKLSLTVLTILVNFLKFDFRKIFWLIWRHAALNLTYLPYTSIIFSTEVNKFTMFLVINITPYNVNIMFYWNQTRVWERWYRDYV